MVIMTKKVEKNDVLIIEIYNMKNDRNENRNIRLRICRFRSASKAK